MEDFMDSLVEILAVTLSLGIPLAAVICLAVWKIKDKRMETDLRKTITDAHLDAETAKVLISQPTAKKSPNKYGNLTGGLLFVGLGLGAVAGYALGLEEKTFSFLACIALGMGAGLLASFLITWKLSAKSEEKDGDREEQ